MTFNPQQLRLGNKILRQRLRGPALAAWYPRKTVSFRDLQETYRPLGLTIFDEAEDDREEAIQMYEEGPVTLICTMLMINYPVRNYAGRADQKRREQQQVFVFQYSETIGTFRSNPKNL
jgi:hypothetical protein